MTLQGLQRDFFYKAPKQGNITRPSMCHHKALKVTLPGPHIVTLQGHQTK